jgi:NAD-dependent DNA ligase
MDIFTRFNRKGIQDRQVDTLIGLSKGLIADQKINQAEAEFLMSWLVQNRQASDNPVICNLLDKVAVMLEDGVLDADEASELLRLLQSMAGDQYVIGELAKTSSLPVNYPLPAISFDATSFLFTGTCAYGTRRACQAVIESLGALNAKGVTKSLNYLVLGTYVTDSWAHETFGRKIEKAMQYRDNGLPIAIVTEEHWANEAGL